MVFKYQGKYLGEEINESNGKVRYFDLTNLKLRHTKPTAYYVEFYNDKPTHCQKVVPKKITKESFKKMLKEIKKLFKDGSL